MDGAFFDHHELLHCQDVPEGSQMLQISKGLSCLSLGCLCSLHAAGVGAEELEQLLSARILQPSPSELPVSLCIPNPSRLLQLWDHLSQLNDGWALFQCGKWAEVGEVGDSSPCSAEFHF